MNRVVPWAELAALIAPVYPKVEGPGHPPVGVESMLRLHCLQQWFNLSDPAVYGSRHAAIRRHYPGPRAFPNETTICKFRHLLELINGCTALCADRGVFGEAGACRPAKALLWMRPSLVRAQFDEESHEEAGFGDASDEEGHQWYFGMKAISK